MTENIKLKSATCKYNIGYKWFSPNIKKDLTTKCKEGSGDESDDGSVDDSGDNYENGSDDGE